MAGITKFYDQKRIKRMCFIVGNGRVASMVKAATGAHVVINANFYNMSTYVPNFHVKSEGVVRGDPGWNGYYGFAWNSVDLMKTHKLDFQMVKLADSSFDSYCSGYQLLTPDKGMSAALDSTIPSYNTKRGRTIIGITDDDRICIHLVGDGDKESLTAKQSRQLMYDAGCKYAMLFDGGGSSQGGFEDGSYIYASREVYDFLCIWLYTDEEMEEIYGSSEKPEEKPETTILYRVQVGAFTVKQNAENLRQKLIALGYDDAFIQTAAVNGRVFNRVQVGAFSVKQNADNLLTKLAEQGYDDAFIQVYEVKK